MTDAVAEVARLEARQPDLVRLARLASVAAVVEPPLLRRLRVEVPGSDPSPAGLEADLWFSPLAHVATSALLTLRPEVLEVLRAQLAEPQHHGDRDGARDVVTRAHEQHSDMLRLEERIIWATLVDDPADLGAAWERVIATLKLGTDRAAEAVRWFLQARRRLPATALAHPTAQRLAAASALHVDRVVPPEVLAANRFPDALDGVAPLSLPTTRVGVRLAEGGLHFVAPDDVDAGVLTLPKTRPLVVEVTWGATSAVVRADPGAVASLSGLTDVAVLRTLAGARWRLRASQAKAASLDGRAVVVTGCEDGTVRVWDLSTHTPVAETLVLRDKVVAIATAVLPDGQRVAVLGLRDSTIRVWDLESGAPSGELVGHDGSFAGLATAALPDDRVVAIAGFRDGTVKVWDLSSDALLGELTGHRDRVTAVATAVLPDGQVVAVAGSRDGTVRVWDLSRGAPLSELRGHTDRVTAVATAVLPDGRVVAVSTAWDDTVRIWDLSSGEAHRSPLTGHTHSASSVATAVIHGRVVALSAARGDGVRAWDLATATPLAEPLLGRTSSVASLATATLPDRVVAVTTAPDRTVQVWDLDTGEPLGEPLDHTATATAIATLSDRGAADPPVVRTVKLAVFGRVDGIDRLQAEGLPGVDVQVIHEPEDLDARPDIVVAGVLSGRSRTRLRSVVEQLTRVSPSSTVAFFDRRSSIKVREELRQLLGDALATVEYPDDTDVFEGLRELVAGLADTAYRLDVQTALTLLPAVAQAILDSPGLAEQPASLDREHVRIRLGPVLGEQVPAWLNGSDVRLEEPWTSFPVYLDWFAARLTDWAEGVSPDLHVGALPLELVNAARLVLAPEVDLVLVEVRRAKNRSQASFELESDQVPTLVERLFAPVIAAVGAEASRRPQPPSPTLAALASLDVVLEVSTTERGWDVQLLLRDDRIRAATRASPDLGRTIDSLLARGGTDLTMLRGVGRRLADNLPPELLYRFEEVLAEGGSVLIRAETDLPWELLEVRRGLDTTFLGCQASVQVMAFPPTGRSFVWTPTPGTRIGIVAPAYPNATLVSLEALDGLNVEVLPTSGGALLQALVERETYAILHFDGHFTADDRGSGILLDADRPLTAEQLVALELAHAPLVFLNGRAGADLVRAFLRAGASAVVSALWTPTDVQAMGFANRFYGHVANGIAPDEALRLLRNQYDDPAIGTTALAYRITVSGQRPWTPNPPAS